MGLPTIIENHPRIAGGITGGVLGAGAGAAQGAAIGGAVGLLRHLLGKKTKGGSLLGTMGHDALMGAGIGIGVKGLGGVIAGSVNGPKAVGLVDKALAPPASPAPDKTVAQGEDDILNAPRGESGKAVANTKGLFGAQDAQGRPMPLVP